MSSTYGEHLKLSIFGQSHGAAIGMTLDGIPAGLPVDMEQLQKFLSRRAPGQHDYATPRKEADQPEFLAGIVNGFTCGAPIAAVIANTNTRSGDYSQLKDIPRPGHADYTAQMKYHGFQDVAGGGHFSGRLTAPLCIAGAFCLALLRRIGIEVGAHIQAVGSVKDRPYDRIGLTVSTLHAPASTTFPVLDPDAGEAMRGEIECARMAADSVGGSVECAILGLPVGLGDHPFDGAEGRISSILFSIPAVKAVAFGDGFDFVTAYGSTHNDPYGITSDGRIVTTANHCGGIVGGMTTGMPLVFSCAFKPTPSIGSPQASVSLSKMENTTLTIHGRHDPCIIPRAVPVVEAAAAIALVDMLLDEPSMIQSNE